MIMPTLSLFCMAEKDSTDAISAIKVFLNRLFVPNADEPLTSTSSMTVSSRSSSKIFM